jgi:hypothetical protein
MKARLSKSVIQFREQADDAYPDRDRRSDGTYGDARHSTKKSDHNPCVRTGFVRAFDLDVSLDGKDATAHYLADQIRVNAKSDKRIAYVIFNKRIASKRTLWKWIKYRGTNPHTKHIHISFTKAGDEDRSFFQIPMLGGKA